MTIQASELLRRRVPCDFSAPRLVRQALAALEVVKAVRDDALLIASELVTHAVLYSGCEPSDEVEIVAEMLPEALRIVVSDPGHAQRTASAEPSFPAAGLGLRVVTALARRWGTERHAGLRVWAELPL